MSDNRIEIREDEVVKITYISENISKVETIIDKKTFIECFNKWIKENR